MRSPRKPLTHHKRLQKPLWPNNVYHKEGGLAQYVKKTSSTQKAIDHVSSATQKKGKGLESEETLNGQNLRMVRVLRRIPTL